MIVTDKTKSVVRKVNSQKYADLLKLARPTRISTEADYDRAIAFVDKLITKAKPNTEEEKILELMVTLIEVYESEHYPIPRAEPRSVIKMLMEDRGLEQKDLIGVLGSKSAVSQVLNGNRHPSKTQVKNLAEFFHVKPELFVSFAE